MPNDRPWTDADRELVAKAVHDHACTGDDCSWSEEPRPCDLTEFTGFADAVLDALADAGRLLPPDVELTTRQRCECGHHPSDHPAGARCMHGMTWTQPATCHCRGFVAASSRREWTEPWRSVKGATDAR